MEELVEDFLQYLRNERGQSEARSSFTPSCLQKFIDWAKPRSSPAGNKFELVASDPIPPG